MKLFSSSFSSPIGDFFLLAHDSALLMAEFADSRELEKRKNKILKNLGKTEKDIENGENGVLTQTKKELREYFDGTRMRFDVPLELFGTDFQKKAWHALMLIPYGETRSYKEEALLMHHSKAVRAIGGANHENCLPVIIPCHRVIGADGKLVGYGGGIERKIWLLEHEKKHMKK